MNTLDPPDLHLTLRQALAEHGGVRLAILFGSQATGHATALSDIDLAVQMAAPLEAVDKIALIERLALATGLLGSDTDYATLLSRHLFDAADFLPYRNRILAERRQAWIGR